MMKDNRCTERTKRVLFLAREEARRLQHDGKGSEAVLILREIIARNPANVMALAALGSSLAATGDLDGAIETARHVVALNPRLDMAYQNLGVALGTKAILLSRRSGAPEAAAGSQQGTQAGGGAEDEGWRFAREAAAAFERALQISPRYAETILAWARMNIELLRPDEARSVLLRGRAARIEDPDLELELGRIDAARGDLRSAADALERSLALNARSEDANELAGRVWFQLGEYGKAADRYGLALDLSGRADLARTLGSIRLYKLDDPRGALVAFRRALELDPDGPESESLREIIHQLAGAESR